MERLKYRIKKLNFLLTIKFQSFSTKLFYRNNINSDFQNIINKNRGFLKSIDSFLPIEVYQNNDYGIQQRIYQKLDDEIVDLPTYSDLISFLIAKIYINEVNYLEIGVSVLKNFLQINNASAIPLGDSCISYSIDKPKNSPLPNSLLYNSNSFFLTIIKISLIPASINVDKG